MSVRAKLFAALLGWEGWMATCILADSLPETSIVARSAVGLAIPLALLALRTSVVVRTWALIATVGIGANLLVVAANGGRMPVVIPASWDFTGDEGWVRAIPKTHSLLLLADRFPTTDARGLTAMKSAGDYAIDFAWWLGLVSASGAAARLIWLGRREEQSQ